MKYSELIYICADLSKSLTSDDSFFTEDHIRFLLNKHRSQLLYEKYKSNKESIPTSNYQTLCLDLEVADIYDGDICGNNTYLRSVETIPSLLAIGSPFIYPKDYYQGNITWVSRERMRYVGNNKYMRNIIYASLGTDNRVYFKSSNPMHINLCKVNFNGIFEDAEKAIELSCNKDSKSCDILNADFSIEEALVPQLILIVVQELSGSKFQPVDKGNDAKDILSDIYNYIKTNVKSDLAKQMTE